MIRELCLLSLFILVLSSCLKNSSSSDEAASPVEVEDETELTIADTAVANTLAIETGEGAGTIVDLPANTLPSGAKVSLKVVETPADLVLDNMTSASTALNIVAVGSDGAPVIPATAFTVSLVINNGSSLTEVPKTDENLCAVLSAVDGSKLVWRSASLVITGDKATLKSLAFGVFKLVYCGKETLQGFTEVKPSGEILTPVAATTPPSLEGNWLSACLVENITIGNLDDTIKLFLRGIRMAVGKYELGVNLRQAQYGNDDATSGYADLTSVSNDTLVGTFNFNTENGNRTGSFNIPKAGSGNFESNAPQATLLLVEGNDFSYVTDSAILSYNFKGNISTFIHKRFEVTPNCAPSNFAFESRFINKVTLQAALGAGDPSLGRKVDFALQDVKLTPRSVNTVESLEGACGIPQQENWVKDVERSILGQSHRCGGLQIDDTKSFAAGDPEKQIVRYDGNKLKFGKRATTGYPTVFSENTVFSRQP